MRWTTENTPLSLDDLNLNAIVIILNERKVEAILFAQSNASYGVNRFMI